MPALLEGILPSCQWKTKVPNLQPTFAPLSNAGETPELLEFVASLSPLNPNHRRQRIRQGRRQDDRGFLLADLDREHAVGT